MWSSNKTNHYKVGNYIVYTQVYKGSLKILTVHTACSYNVEGSTVEMLESYNKMLASYISYIFIIA